MLFFNLRCPRERTNLYNSGGLKVPTGFGLRPIAKTNRFNVRVVKPQVAHTDYFKKQTGGPRGSKVKEHTLELHSVNLPPFKESSIPIRE